MTYRAITSCRLCGNRALEPVLDLGVQALTGVFPRSLAEDAAIERAPLLLVRCAGESSSERGPCGLVQLAGNVRLESMYGAGYGYRSGLNASMVRHLTDKAASLVARRPLARGDVVLDIGSNDGTTLGAYPQAARDAGAVFVGIDPTIAKFADHYRPDIVKVPRFFDSSAYREAAGDRPAAIVTSIAMLHDLPTPQAFVDDVASILADDGVWHFEQHVTSAMLAANAYDTVCHEHLEYYGLAQIARMLEKAGLRIVDVAFNDVNGGSVAVTAMRGVGHADLVAPLIADERARTGRDAWARFAAFAAQHKQELPERLHQLQQDGARVLGLGASTKGNVLLQHCGIDSGLLSAIGEINDDKVGGLTPGTRIPIVSEREALRRHPDVMLVLPWHFRASFVRSQADFLARGGALLFPLPTIDAVRA